MVDNSLWIGKALVTPETFPLPRLVDKFFGYIFQFRDPTVDEVPFWVLVVPLLDWVVDA